MSNQISGTATTSLVPSADVQHPPIDRLIDDLLVRWRGKGAPRSVLAKAAVVDREFRTRHAAVRHDRQFVTNIAFLVASIGALGIATIGITLIELQIGSGELVSRMIVLALLVGACISLSTRGGHRLAAQFAVLGAFVAILFAGPPTDFQLRGWDKMSVMIGTALIAAKAARLFVDRMLDRHEARLLLEAAGRR